MTNKIARGTTGLAELVVVNNKEYYDTNPDGYWWVVNEDYANSNNKNGWDITISPGAPVPPVGVFFPSWEYGFISVPIGILSNGIFADISYYYGGKRLSFRFEVVCVKVTVRISKQSSSPVDGSNPIEYEHRYAVEAKAEGGITPYIYSWSSSVGSLSTNGESGILTVTNSNPNYGGVTGTVSCTVTDSDDPECEDTDEAAIEDGNPSIEGGGPCIPSATGASTNSCSCQSNQCTPPCLQSTGNNSVGSGGSIAERFGNYPQSGASQPTVGMMQRY